ncbi:MAG TPA: serine hydrolase domain-containing protein [Streptosporangiaceae bacterium]|nr:serine hydrolase domain-containing protein [Streptosporangiaceae bacterium]
MIGGSCDARFEPVRDAFTANFESLGETGAAICVAAGGRPVVDLWGGWTTPARNAPWQADTLVNFFSVGKGLLAALAARCAGLGVLGLDEPVATYWPDFGAAGKDRVTVRELLSHQAGVPAIRRRLPPGAMLDWDLMTGAIADQAPWWEPGSAHGYHVNTFGFAVGELLRRASGRTVGALLRAELAGPLGADVHIGLPASEHRRVAEFSWPGQVTDETDRKDLDADRLMEHNAYFNPAGLSGGGVVNTASWRSAEVPATNGHGTARGIARVYAALAAGGAVDGLSVVDAGALADAVAEQVYGEDLILHRRSRFGLGFQLTQPERPMGRGATAFGHFGAGGSLGFCDPDAGLAVGYVTGQMGPRWQNPRNRALIDAIYGCM